MNKFVSCFLVVGALAITSEFGFYKLINFFSNFCQIKRELNFSKYIMQIMLREKNSYIRPSTEYNIIR